MRATTRAAVEPLDAHDAQRPLALGRLPQSLRFGGLLELNGHRAILAHDLVGAPLRFAYDRGFDGVGLEIDRGTLGAQMEAEGVQSELLCEDRRKQVLPGVLLHVIEAARPVDRAVDDASLNRRGQPMCDSLPLIA